MNSFSLLLNCKEENFNATSLVSKQADWHFRRAFIYFSKQVLHQQQTELEKRVKYRDQNWRSRAQIEIVCFFCDLPEKNLKTGFWIFETSFAKVSKSLKPQNLVDGVSLRQEVALNDVGAALVPANGVGCCRIPDFVKKILEQRGKPRLIVRK